MERRPGFWTRLWRRLRGRCVHCGARFEVAESRILLTGTQLVYCPNRHRMQERAVDYMFGEYDHTVREFYGTGPLPAWAEKFFSELDRG